MDPYCDRSTTVENLFFELGRSMNDRKSFSFLGLEVGIIWKCISNLRLISNLILCLENKSIDV